MQSNRFKCDRKIQINNNRRLEARLREKRLSNDLTSSYARRHRPNTLSVKSDFIFSVPFCCLSVCVCVRLCCGLRIFFPFNRTYWIVVKAKQCHNQTTEIIDQPLRRAQQPTTIQRPMRTFDIKMACMFYAFNNSFFLLILLHLLLLPFFFLAGVWFYCIFPLLLWL